MALGRILFLLVLSGIPLSAVAAESSIDYRLIRPGCPAKAWKNGAWISSGLPWKPGDQVSTKPGKSPDNILFFDYEGTTFATGKSCWVRITEGAEVRRPIAVPPAPQEPLKRTFGFGYLGWQEPVQLTRASDSTTFPLQSFQSGWSLHSGREFAHFGNWTLAGIGGGFIASSSIMTSSKDEAALAGLNYRTTDALAFGGWIGPELDWSTGSRETQLGLLIPVLYRKTNWPDVSSGAQEYQIERTSQFLVGALLSYGVRREAWELTARLGYLRGSSSLFWLLGVSRAWDD